MLWVGMGGHRSMLMLMVWVWVQIRRKMLGFVVQAKKGRHMRWPGRRPHALSLCGRQASMRSMVCVATSNPPYPHAHPHPPTPQQGIAYHHYTPPHAHAHAHACIVKPLYPLPWLPPQKESRKETLVTMSLVKDKRKD